MIAGSYGKRIFSFVRNRQTIFQSTCTILHSYRQYRRVVSAPHAGGIWSCQSSRLCPFLCVCSGISLFNFAFSFDMQCGACFYVLTCHLYIFDDVSFKVFCSFLNWVVFLLLSCKGICLFCIILLL